MSKKNRTVEKKNKRAQKASEVHVSDFDSKHRVDWFSRKVSIRVMAIVVSLLLVVIGVAITIDAVTRSYTLRERIAKNNQNNAIEQKKEEAALKQDYASNYATLQQELTQLSGDEKADKLVELVIVARRLERYDDALRYAQEFDTAAQTDTSAAMVGEIYAFQHNWQQAMQSYDIAMQRADKPEAGDTSSPYNDYLTAKQQAENELRNAQ